eukprot:scaffold2246_cov162-Amphora_coffeaeformis.AAC.27
MSIDHSSSLSSIVVRFDRLILEPTAHKRFATMKQHGCFVAKGMSVHEWMYRCLSSIRHHPHLIVTLSRLGG